MMRDLSRGAYDHRMQIRGRIERWPVWATDGVLAIVLAILSAVSLASIPSAEQAIYSREPDAFAYILVLVQTLPLTLRRVYPLPILAVVVAGFFVDRGLDYPSTIASVGFAFAFHSLGSQLPHRRSLLIGLPIVAFLTLFTVSGVFFTDSVSWASVFLIALVTTAPLMLGREVHEKRRYLVELEERAAQLEAEREARARQAVREERARIARELHDVVAHEMTVMTIQAAAARRVLDRTPEEVGPALDAIESAGHDALAEMRRLLGLLRTDGGPEFAPQPGLQRLDGLVEQMRDAGLTIDLEIKGEPTGLPTGVDLNAYRIVQESLTNTMKHGGPNVRAVVRVVYGADDVVVSVEDDGRGAAGALAPGNGDGHGHGHGIVGMRERTSMLGGDFAAGPRRGGGYRVKARLPIGTA
jgi:signal transduction histidine kinase